MTRNVTYELQEGRDDGGIVNLLDDEHRQRRLVPGQSLGRRVLNRPVEQRSVKMKLQL